MRHPLSWGCFHAGQAPHCCCRSGGFAAATRCLPGRWASFGKLYQAHSREAPHLPLRWILEGLSAIHSSLLWAFAFSSWGVRTSCPARPSLFPLILIFRTHIIIDMCAATILLKSLDQGRVRAFTVLFGLRDLPAADLLVSVQTLQKFAQAQSLGPAPLKAGIAHP